MIFHNLKGYDGHLIFKELSRFNNLKIGFIPNGLEKYMAFIINENLVFIDRMQRMNSILDKWKVFKIKNHGEYHDLYLKTDVLLLVDVFEKFVETCLNYYRLDPCHYYYFSSAGLSWDAMLKMAKMSLQKIHNVNMHIFIEKGVSYWCFL